MPTRPPWSSDKSWDVTNLFAKDVVSVTSNCVVQCLGNKSKPCLNFGQLDVRRSRQQQTIMTYDQIPCIKMGTLIRKTTVQTLSTLENIQGNLMCKNKSWHSKKYIYFKSHPSTMKIVQVPALSSAVRIPCVSMSLVDPSLLIARRTASRTRLRSGAVFAKLKNMEREHLNLNLYPMSVSRRWTIGMENHKRKKKCLVRVVLRTSSLYGWKNSGTVGHEPSFNILHPAAHLQPVRSWRKRLTINLRGKTPQLTRYARVLLANACTGTCDGLRIHK